VRSKTLRARDAERWCGGREWLASANQMLFTFDWRAR